MRTAHYTIAAGSGFGPATASNSMEYATIRDREKAIRRAYRGQRWTEAHTGKDATVAQITDLVDEYGTIPQAIAASKDAPHGILKAGVSFLWYQV